MSCPRLTKTLIALAAACAVWPALADDSARLKELEQKLDASLRTIQALQQRVDQLERKDGARAAAVPAAAAPASVDARLESVERSVAQIEASTSVKADTGLPIHGFADVGAGVRNQDAAGEAARGFTVGVFDLYMTPQFGDRVKGLVELAFEFNAAGELAVDLERLQLGYAFNDALTLWGGRFHTPYGYWNTAFHHGAQLQTTISRPRFLEFEDAGGFLPAHSVGAWATGSWRTGAGKLGYDLYAVNGDRINAGVLDFQAAGDSDANVGYGFRTQLALGTSGLTFGLHGLNQRVAGENAAATASATVRVNMLGAFAVYETDDWEGLAEYYRFRNRESSGGSGRHTSSAWYAQLGYNVGERFVPYARAERAALDATDPYFALQDSGRSYRRTVAGLRYNLTPTAALKAEWMRTTEPGVAGTPSSVALQYSTRF